MSTYNIKTLEAPAKPRSPRLRGIGAATYTSGAGGIEFITKQMIENVLTGDITSHEHSRYLEAAKFNELFEKVDINGTPWIKAKLSLYTEGALSALGVGDAPSGGGSGMSYDRLDRWADYSEGAGAVLSAYLGWGLKQRIDNLEASPYTHPPYSAITKTSTGGFLNAISVDALGHVTSVGQSALKASDIPDLSSLYLTNVKTLSLNGGTANELKGAGNINLNAATLLTSNATGLVGGSVNTQGTLSLSFDNGYSIPTTAKQQDWENARIKLDDLFEKETVNGATWIKAKYNFYSVGAVSALGSGTAPSAGTGGGGVSYDRLDRWADYTQGSGAVLSADLGWGLKSEISSHTHSYLPLSGGTMTGDIMFGQASSMDRTGIQSRFPSHFYRNTYSEAGDVYDHYYNGATTATNSTAHLRVKSGSGIKELVFSGNGGFSWLGYSILHAGNYSSYVTKAYVDSLGLNDGNISASRWYYKNDNHGWPTYLLIADVTDYSLEGDGSTKAGFEGLIFIDRGRENTYNMSAVIRVVATQAYRSVVLQTDNDWAMPCRVTYNGRTYIALQLRSSDHYGFMIGRFWRAMQTFTQLNSTAADGSLSGLTITHNFSGMPHYGNASTASALEYSRTLWGQSFNGTGNVSGDMTGVGSITRANANAVDADVYGNLKFKSTSPNDHWNVRTNSDTIVLDVTNSGNVGIGTTSPAYKLDVNGAMRASGTLSVWSNTGNYGQGMRIHAATDGWTALMLCGAENTADTGTSVNSWSMHTYQGNFYLNKNNCNGSTGNEFCNVGGNWGIGTTSPDAKLHVAGVIHATTGIYSDGYVSALGTASTSDRRLKTDIKPWSVGVEQVAALPSVAFRWAKGGKEDVGSIAQDLALALPLCVREDANGYLGIDYGKAALLSVIATAKRTISNEEEIKALKARVQELENELRQYNG